MRKALEDDKALIHQKKVRPHRLAAPLGPACLQ